MIIQVGIKEVVYFSHKHAHKQGTAGSKRMLDMAAVYTVMPSGAPSRLISVQWVETLQFYLAFQLKALINGLINVLIHGWCHHH